MKVLFIGIGGTPQTWYRCALPARALGQDWVGMDGGFHVITGQVGGKSGTPDLSEYDTVVVQQPAGEEWLKRLHALKRMGARVLYETDDYLRAIPQVKDHVYAKYFTRRVLRNYEMCMEVCDGTIVSTKFLAERYSKYAPMFHCRNGIDMKRYQYERPSRDYLTVGWAGATGHAAPFAAWLDGGVGRVLKERPSVRFVGVGLPEVPESVAALIGADRVTHIPWSAFDTYPAAMAGCDVLLAPAGNTHWDRGKSDLRWLEASALGAASVCDERRYPEAELRASSPEQAADLLKTLLDDPELVNSVGERERERVLQTRSFPAAAEPWSLTFTGKPGMMGVPSTQEES